MNSSWWQRLGTSLVVYLSLAAMYLRPVQAEDLSSIRSLIRKKFPNVRQLSTQQLAEWLAETNRPAPLLLDVRGADEFALSHLRAARNITSFKHAAMGTIAKDQPIVTYCSVGYRSSEFAEKLHEAGFTNVWNLEGSIFAWANEGRPIFRGTNRVTEVHPFSAKWGKLLKSELHPKTPPP